MTEQSKREVTEKSHSKGTEEDDRAELESRLRRRREKAEREEHESRATTK